MLSIGEYHSMVWDQYCVTFPELRKFDCPKVILSNRLTTTAGYNTYWENSVTYSNKLYLKHGMRFLSEIVPHEIAHQIDFNLNYKPGDIMRSFHNAQFYSIGRKAGWELVRCHSM